MPRIYIKATGTKKFIRVTDLLTPESFGPKEQKTSDDNWAIDIGGFDKKPDSGSVMIEVANDLGGPYKVHEGNKLVKSGDVCPVDDSNLPMAAGGSAKKKARQVAA